MKYVMELVDHADGVRGHFCIGRRIPGLSIEVWEFYNPSGWAGHGQLFTSRASAEFVMARLQKQQESFDVASRGTR